MNKINYDKKMQEIISENREKGVKPKILLHACCAPCSSAVVERIKEDFDITVFFYNPNMDTEEEYFHRLNEEIRFCKNHNISVIDIGYNPSEFYTAVKGFENYPEGDKRCFVCYGLRLDKCAEVAKEKGFDYFSTTLTVSPLKNAEVLNEKGFEAQEKYGVKFLPSDFKKRGGYLRSIELSKEYDLYRQNYCGCVFSKNN